MAIATSGLQGTTGEPAGHASPRRAIAWAAEVGFRAVQIDGTVLKARELDRSARRDLAATFRRHELAIAGIDLWIPPSHFAREEAVDRAASALVESLDLAADLADLVPGSRRVVSVEFPATVEASALEAIRVRADRRGAMVADHAWPMVESRLGGPVMFGLDPSALLLAGVDPAATASRFMHMVASARLSDLAATGRVAPGEGRLDLLAYRVALETGGFRGPLVLDLRQVPAGVSKARTILARWSS